MGAGKLNHALCANLRRIFCGVNLAGVDCSRCGDYSIEHVTADEIGLPLKDSKLRALASHVIRKLQGGTRPYLTTEFFVSLTKRTLPTPAEASDNLLLWLAEEADGSPGKPIVIAYSDVKIQALIGVISDSDLKYVALELQAQGLLRATTHGEMYQGRLAPSGWRRVEELRRAHVASRYAFFARKFDNPDLDRVFDECLRPVVAQTGFELRTVPQRAGLVDDN